MTKIRKQPTSNAGRRGVGEGNHHSLLVELKTGTAAMETRVENYQKSKNKSAI